MPEIPPDSASSILPEPEGIQFTVETLVDAVYAGFSPKNRERISRDDVARIVAELKLDEERQTRKSPFLRVLRLRFAGVKNLRGRQPEAFIYDQTFAPGVNVICIPDNEVGKSSILKTIKYALTGDDADYDADVRSWITDVWLAFVLDKQEFTVLLSNRDSSPHALLVPGREFRQIETVLEESTSALFDSCGADPTKAELQRFFFQRLGLRELSWTQQDPSVPGGVAKRSTSWLTYFQAIEILDVGDRYLLCDPQHAIGNQEGLIFSAFLGLNLVEALNQLGVEAARTKKDMRIEDRLTAEMVQQAQEVMGRLHSEIQAIRTRLKEFDAAQGARRRAVEGGTPAQRLIEVQSALVEGGSEQASLEAERDELNRNIQRGRGRERHLREAVVLRLHFTGLEVSLCPNCDAAVDTEAVERERTAHACRLCGKHARCADSLGIEALTAEADGIKRRIEDGVRGRDSITTRLSTLRNEANAFASEEAMLKDAVQEGIAFALPTSEEETERSALLERVGRLNAELDVARPKAVPRPTQDGERDVRVRVLEKVREVLAKEADQRNRRILERLSKLTQEMTRRIGAESISDVTCTALGQVQLRKHGERVSFTGIHNEGERLRVKLAFFTAMMRLGREAGLGRHPGFLLIDQPGSSEMVPEDFEALAEIFRRVDAELADQVQIISCTARREFEAATELSKVYGPQAPPYAF